MRELSLKRRDLIKVAGSLGLGAIVPTMGCSKLGPEQQAQPRAHELRSRQIQTVRGLIAAENFGPALVHEHVMCDFIGAERTGKHRYGAREVVEVMRPYLDAVRAQGVTGFVDCTPMFIGRDPEVLARLSEDVGIHILTNTGLYKAPFLPQFAFDLPPDKLAELWVREFEEGIEGTGVRPGFIKIAVNPGHLVPVQQKIVRAACWTSRATGMVIACHTAKGVAAGEAIDIVQGEDVPAENFIFVHADSEPDPDQHLAAARRGAWVEYDGIRPKTQERSLERVRAMLSRGFADRLLLSQDAGWYYVGEHRGGEPAEKIRGYTYLWERFLPLLHESGTPEATIARLIVENPARAFALDERARLS